MGAGVFVLVPKVVDVAVSEARSAHSHDLQSKQVCQTVLTNLDVAIVL
jgi:hypothetical protein